jgi:hypothetical protein
MKYEMASSYFKGQMFLHAEGFPSLTLEDGSPARGTP